MVLAPDRLPVRQWLLPEGRPAGPVIEPGGNSRAVASYREGDRTILVVADAQGLLRRSDAATGAPVGEPVRYGPPEPSRGPLSRLARRPEAPTFPGSLTLGISAGPPSFVVTDRDGALWTVRCWTTMPSSAQRRPRRDSLARGSAALVVS